MRHGPTQEYVAEIAESIEVDAWTDFLRAAPPEAAAGCGIELVERDGAVASLASAVDVFIFNRVVGLGLQAEATEASLDALLGRYAGANVPRYFVQISPSARPHDLREWLRVRGLVHYNSWTKVFYRRQSAAPPRVASDLAVEQIGGDRADEFARIVCAAFEWPAETIPLVAATVGRDGWRHYLAHDGGRAVATGALFVRDDVGWFGFAATAPGFRRRGAQSSLIGRRMHDALEAGCRILIGESAEDRPDRPAPSFRNLRRLGWETLYLRPNFANVPPGQA